MSSVGFETARRRAGLLLLKTAQGVRKAFYRLASSGRREGVSPQCSQPLFFYGLGVLECADEVQIGYFPSPGFLDGLCHIEARARTARVVIGRGTTINNGFTAICETSTISIGARCSIGPGVTIFDSDFHGLSASQRNVASAVQRADVFIGDDVFIGAGAIILKGVRIGARSVVGAGSVVVKSLPEAVIAAGNPARVVGQVPE